MVQKCSMTFKSFTIISLPQSVGKFITLKSLGFPLEGVPVIILYLVPSLPCRPLPYH